LKAAQDDYKRSMGSSKEGPEKEEPIKKKSKSRGKKKGK